MRLLGNPVDRAELERIEPFRPAREIPVLVGILRRAPPGARPAAEHHGLEERSRGILPQRLVERPEAGFVFGALHPRPGPMPEDVGEHLLLRGARVHGRHLLPVRVLVVSAAADVESEAAA